MTSVVRAHWTARIHEEWTSNLLANRPDLSKKQIHRTRSLMDEAVPAAAVDGYEHHIPDLTLPDPDDRHVLAAAIEAGAEWVVTFNKRDFPAKALRPYGVRAADPDEFALGLLEAFPDEVVGAARRHRAALVAPPKSIQEYLATFRRQSLEHTADKLAAYADEL